VRIFFFIAYAEKCIIWYKNKTIRQCFTYFNLYLLQINKSEEKKEIVLVETASIKVIVPLKLWP